MSKKEGLNKVEFHYRLTPIMERCFVSHLVYYSDRWISKGGKKIGAIGWETPEIEKLDRKGNKRATYNRLVAQTIKRLSGRIGIKGYRGYFYIPNAVAEFKKALKKLDKEILKI